MKEIFKRKGSISMLDLVKVWKEEKVELEECLKVVMSGENGSVEEWVEFLLRRVLVVKENKVGRVEEVYGILLEGDFSIREIGERLGIEDKNVSSVLTYIRKRGVLIGTRSNGKKYIEGGVLEEKK